ncbi:MAG: hypothetical protein AVDCRST_MAG96-985 [uncultured Segetibacter sp.]|uniref:DUF3891 family protein n=1 Tax=uncultured Segetibacter sp. TaxID=481133 RepID=A0A6J4RSD3_9BACT|nr:MAG: hypothetical protein AVDCRST_MAG96-985 [uncultured Segetibacter sp.]
MIVNYTEGGWEIITQRAHGLLAAQLAMHWKLDERPERWTETLLAIAEHDDAEVELEGENLLTRQGGPLNFAMRNFELEHCERLSRFSITKSRYIALLTSVHMEFLYKKEEKTNEQARRFLEEQRKLQEGWRYELQLEKEAVEKIYSFLEWCDAFSLLICQQEVQPEHRAIEISQGPHGDTYQLYQVDNNKLTTEPWPFEPASFKVYFESRLISQLQFGDTAEFRQAFHKAKINETVWELVKSKVPDKTSKV